MSVRPCTDPACSGDSAAHAIAAVIDARPRDIGGFAVRRLLPSMAKRAVGPFAFLDHMGPAELPPGSGLDVPPHPHIGLATVTYLFDGEILHRDSLGFQQTIRPGEINWMTAGRGIVHSERTSPELRRTGSRVHGLQLWVALPSAQEEVEPAFHHHDADALPVLDHAGARLRVLLGSAYGATSPVAVFSPMFYVDADLPSGCEVPIASDHQERAAYVVEGTVECCEQVAGAGRMLVFTQGADVLLRATSRSRVVLLGGAPLDGPRHIYWNFVSSSKERIERAKQDWKNNRFPLVPGDELERVPLPE